MTATTIELKATTATTAPKPGAWLPTGKAGANSTATSAKPTATATGDKSTTQRSQRGGQPDGRPSGKQRSRKGRPAAPKVDAERKAHFARVIKNQIKAAGRDALCEHFAKAKTPLVRPELRKRLQAELARERADALAELLTIAEAQRKQRESAEATADLKAKLDAGSEPAPERSQRDGRPVQKGAPKGRKPADGRPRSQASPGTVKTAGGQPVRAISTSVGAVYQAALAAQADGGSKRPADGRPRSRRDRRSSGGYVSDGQGGFTSRYQGADLSGVEVDTKPGARIGERNHQPLKPSPTGMAVAKKKKPGKGKK